MKKTLFYFICSFLFAFPLLAESFELPKEFEVKIKSSVITTFYFESKSLSFGKVVKESIPETVYHFKNNKDQLVATGKALFLPNCAKIEVFDDASKRIGLVKYESFTLLPSKYQLYNNSGQLIAIADMNWLGSRFTLADSENLFNEYVAFTRPYFKLFNDNWHVKIIKQNGIDERLVIMVAAFQADLNTKNSELGN